jgi:hypothetical protein
MEREWWVERNRMEEDRKKKLGGMEGDRTR